MKLNRMYAFLKGTKVFITTTVHGYHTLYEGDMRELPYAISEKHVSKIRLHRKKDAQNEKEVDGMEIEVF